MSGQLETFFDAWSKNDADERSALVSQALSESAVYADPRTPEPLSGIAAISDYVGMFSANAPGWTASVVKSDTISGMARATIAFAGKGPDGNEMQQLGQYFAEFSDETPEPKIVRLIGFVGTGAVE